MRVIQLSAFDKRGGAAIAAERLQQGLVSESVDSKMLVQFKSGDEGRVHAPEGKWSRGLALVHDSLELLPLLPYRVRQGAVFSANLLSSNIADRLKSEQPDLVHLHWVHAGMLSPATLKKFQRPLVWTLHDMWPFTGGCHYAADCHGYERTCGYCPQLNSSRAQDLSRFTFWRKERAWSDLSLKIIAPSQWMADCARKSHLFSDRDIQVIPNGLDLSVWRPVDQAEARKLLGLPEGPLLLFTAARGLSAAYKGGSGLLDILQTVYDSGRKFTLLLMGDRDLPAGVKVRFPVRGLGELHDDISKVLAYSAADVTLHNAQQDNLPNTIAESLACGTPVIANSVGGVPEMIDHKENGLLLSTEDKLAFPQALTWFLDQVDVTAMMKSSLQKARSHYDLSRNVQIHRQLYENFLETDNRQ